MSDARTLFSTHPTQIWPLALRWGPCVGDRTRALWVGVTREGITRLWDELTSERTTGGSVGVGFTVDTFRCERPVEPLTSAAPTMAGPMTPEAWNAQFTAWGRTFGAPSPMTHATARILTEPRRGVWAVRWGALASAGTDWMGLDDLLATRMAVVHTPEEAEQLLRELTQSSAHGTYRATSATLESTLARTWWQLLPARCWAFLLDPDQPGTFHAPRGLAHPNEVALRVLQTMPTTWWQGCGDELWAVLLGSARAEVRALAVTSLAGRPGDGDPSPRTVTRR